MPHTASIQRWNERDEPTFHVSPSTRGPAILSGWAELIWWVAGAAGAYAGVSAWEARLKLDEWFAAPAGSVTETVALIDLDDAVRTYDDVVTGSGVAFLAAAILTMVWGYQALAHQVRERGATQGWVTPGWAVGAWFIPLANFYLVPALHLDLLRMAGTSPPPIESGWRRTNPAKWVV